ncbi:MAG TPA: sulfite exporter TauE/SafE family protein [Candidatus Gemmiger faecigallinarum]|nr:sulfite exporter TauE/SafE family protein [Candidatus Gemmiger faecigallinarum]
MEQLLFILLVFVTNIIQSITGFAGTLLAMPLGILLIGMDQARAVLNVMGLAASAVIVVSSHRDIDRRELLRISCFMGVGILLGLGLMQVAQPQALLTVYGVFLVAFALVRLLSRKSRDIHSRLLLALVLLAAGVVHGLFISGGSLLVVYAVNVLPEKRRFRATLSGVWVILNSVMLVQHIQSGYFTPGLVLLTLVCLVPLFAAVRLGALLHQRVRQSVFLRLTYLLLLISGLLILW